jgi:hypothetical protein
LHQPLFRVSGWARYMNKLSLQSRYSYCTLLGGYVQPRNCWFLKKGPAPWGYLSQRIGHRMVVVNNELETSVRKRLCSSLIYYKAICLQKLRRTTNDRIKHVRCPGPNSNRLPQEYKSEELPHEIISSRSTHSKTELLCQNNN